MDIYLILWVIIQYYYYFTAQKVQLWLLETLSGWFLCPFNMSPPFWEHFLIFGTNR